MTEGREGQSKGMKYVPLAIGKISKWQSIIITLFPAVIENSEYLK